ncbi:methyl-accepting chemotaxis protein [Chitinilyticum piscinae]|uniref:Methyl-accepting chemotaxis protein n=1 Tax=Chitinilyticum piscinae TaxID=2866724 RepID=A0A8J7K2L7_9NEIS|nr:methyl-accepting chemotaxis protein [Chitinilyticum piscinae]MBE9610207.1 methyl-accepting chemotaxis protein [Chitinilyticum piscinae]
MHALFAPALRLLQVFRFPQKFLLIALIMLIPLGYVLTGQLRSYQQTIHLVDRELAGLELAVLTQQIIDQSQRHRGLTTSFLQGKQDFAGAISDTQTKLTALLQEFDALQTKHQEQAPVGTRWDSLRAGIEAQLKQWQSRKPADNFRLHTELIASELVFANDVAQLSTLSLDPEEETYYLQELYFNTLLPLTEISGQARGAGSRIATAGTASQADQVQMHALAAQMRFLAARLEENLARAIAGQGNRAEQRQEDASRLAAAIRLQADAIDSAFASETPQIDAGTYFASVSTLIGQQGHFMSSISDTIRSSLLPRKAELEQARWMALGISLVLVLLAAYGFTAIYLSISGVVRQLQQGSAAMAAGDLSQRLSLSGRDELRLVGDSFNQMADSLTGLIREIRTTSQHVEQSAGQLDSNASEIVSASQQQANASSSMAAAIEQITVSIANVADHASESSQQAKLADAEVRRGEDIMQAVLHEISELAQNIDTLGQRIDTMQAHSTEIGRIVQTIREIADQTNLLALNAAIEAARAGEQGRGFAVVADEVRKLAERTASATQDISKLVGSIQTDTAAAAAGMQDARSEMQRGSTRVGEATQALVVIRHSAGKEREAAAEIDHAMAEQRQASQTVAQSVEQIAGMASNNAQSAEQNAALAQRVRKAARELVQLVEHFRLAGN